MTVATERLPQPYVVDAVVSNDVIARTLTVRLSDAAGGYEQSLWLQAYQHLRAAEQSGSRGSSRPYGLLRWVPAG